MNPFASVPGKFERLSGTLSTHLNEAADDSLRYARRHMRLLAVAAIFSLLSYYFVWSLIFPDDYESIIVRSLASLICIPLLFYNYARGQHDHILRWYWIATLTVVLPFVFGFMLAHNAARAEDIGQTNLIWPLQNVVALVLFMMLVNNGLMSTALWIVATVAVLATVFIGVEAPNWVELRRVYLDPMPLYGFILVVGSLATRNREIIDQEKLAAVAAVGSTIAHELRTPCLGIKALAEGSKSYLPTLIAGYEAAVDHGLDVKRIRNRHVDALKRSLTRIEEETDYANRVIDMLLVNSSDQPLRGLEFQTISAAACIAKAIDRYPVGGSPEPAHIELRIDSDFTLEVPEMLLIHVLFNLIKNAGYYVDKAGGGRISISISAHAREIAVEDTGTGISPENLPKIFDRFFTTTETGHGAGIGLSFCKMVMDGVGGTIECESHVNEFTRFVLKFPETRNV